MYGPIQFGRGGCQIAMRIRCGFCVFPCPGPRSPLRPHYGATPPHRSGKTSLMRSSSRFTLQHGDVVTSPGFTVMLRATKWTLVVG